MEQEMVCIQESNKISKTYI